METETPRVVRLQDDDIRTGIQLEIAATKAQARLEVTIEAAHAFRDQMRQKYNVPETHDMADWLTGFELVQKE